MKILIIEDEKVIADCLREHLTDEGFTVEIAKEGELGASLGGDNEYDLILLDVLLPKMNGLDVLKRIRAKGKMTPIIVLSVVSTTETKTDFLNAGADDYVVKSSSFTELLARIRTILRRQPFLLKESFDGKNHNGGKVTSDLVECVYELENSKKMAFSLMESLKNKKCSSNDILKKFKFAIDSNPMCTSISDADGIILYTNTAFETLTGFPRAEALGKKIGSFELGGGLMDVDFYIHLWKTIKTDKQTFVGEVKNATKDGKEVIYKLIIYPIVNDKNEVIFFVENRLDITEEKKIASANAEFASMASHQMKNPLTIIGWYTEMLLAGKAGTVTDKERQFLERIFQSNNHMVELVDSLLNVSRIEMRSQSMSEQPVDFVELVNSTIDEFLLKIDSKKLHIKKTFDEILPKVCMDIQWMRMIAQNLLSNAVKYTKENGCIHVSVSRKDSSILLTVEDNGLGIPESQKMHIFSKLFRADNAKEANIEGTGLGLYIVKSLVEKMNGKIWFESEENKGTTFFVTFPTMPEKTCKVKDSFFIN